MQYLDKHLKKLTREVGRIPRQFWPETSVEEPEARLEPQDTEHAELVHVTVSRSSLYARESQYRHELQEVQAMARRDDVVRIE